MIPEIIYNDNEICVTVKPVGVLSQESANNDNMVSMLKDMLKSEIYPLHRLDKEVGGVMVFSKTKASASKLSKDIANHNFCKEYLALVHNKPQELSGRFEDFLFKDSTKNKVFVVKTERKGVKKAALDYEVIKTLTLNGQLFSLVKLRLITGRTHQIRVQFASRKMPLAGDKKYGAKDDFATIGLFSKRLEFFHPKTNKMLSFEAVPDNYLKDYIQ